MHAKHRLLSFVAAALLLGACSDGDPVGVETRPETRATPAGPQLATAPVGPQWYIFTYQEPAQYLDAAPGWEAGTRFKTSKAGKIVGLWFWRAPGETGTNTGRLWTESGQQLASADFPGGSSGWVYVQLQTPVAIAVNTNYRVSVNTNTEQAKTFGYFNEYGPIVNGPLTADAGYYGQPTGSMPTQHSGSIFFVDVQFQEDVPLPNLYVAAIDPRFNDINGNPVLFIRICNEGPGAAGSTYLRYRHDTTPIGGGTRTIGPNWHLYVPGLAAGACYDHRPQEYSAVGYFHEYHVWADINDAVYETNENNYAYSSWARQF